MRVSKWWQNFHFWVNHHFNLSFLHLYEFVSHKQWKEVWNKDSRSHAEMYHMLWVIKRNTLAIQFDLQLLKRASPTSIQSRVLIFSSVRFVFFPRGTSHPSLKWHSTSLSLFFSPLLSLSGVKRERSWEHKKYSRPIDRFTGALGPGSLQ